MNGVLWVIAVLAGLAALFLLALCVPVDAVFDWDSSSRPKHKFRVVWLFGLVKIEPRGKGKKPTKKPAQEEERPDARRKKVAGLGTALKIMRIRGLPGKALRLVKDVFRQFSFRDLLVDLKIGLDNPADTAMLFAAIGPAMPFLPLSSHRHNISLRPSFPDVAFEGRIHGEIRLQPVRLVIPSLRFIFSRPALRLMRTTVFTKREKD